MGEMANTEDSPITLFRFPVSLAELSITTLGVRDHTRSALNWAGITKLTQLHGPRGWKLLRGSGCDIATIQDIQAALNKLSRDETTIRGSLITTTAKSNTPRLSQNPDNWGRWPTQQALRGHRFQFPISLEALTVRALPFQRRTHTVLEALGITTLSQLRRLCAADLLWQRNCNAQIIEDIQLTLDRLSRKEITSLEHLGYEHKTDILNATPSKVVYLVPHHIPKAYRERHFQIPASFAELSVSQVPFRLRTHNVLSGAGITTLSQLQGLRAGDLLRERNCGTHTIEDIQTTLDKLVREETVSDATANYPNTPSALTSAFQFPPSLDSVEVQTLPFRCRTHTVLEDMGVKTLSDLRRFTIDDMLSRRNCGKKTIQDIQATLNQLSPDVVASCEASQHIKVSEFAKEWKLESFPFPVRLQNAFKKKGMHLLRDLDGLSLRELKSTKNIGRTSIQELFSIVDKINKGEFGASSDETADPQSFANLVDQYLHNLPSRVRKTIEFRLGATKDRMTLEEIGHKLNFTRERARQICEKHIEKFRHTYGPQIPKMLEALTSIATSNNRPIQWSDISVDGSGNRYRSIFYLRILKELSPRLMVFGITTWTPQLVTDTYGSAVRWIERKAGLVLGRFTVDAAYAKLKEQQGPCSIPLEAEEILKQSGRLRVHALPDGQVVVVPKTIGKPTVLKSILANSRDAMTVGALHTQLRRVLKNLGYEPGPGIRSLHNILHGMSDVFYFGRYTYGLEQHVPVGRKQWPELVEEFRKHLRKHGRPATTNEFVQTHPEWGRQLTAQVLAGILRDAADLTDLGRQLFALPEWRLSKREMIADIVMETLRSTRQPMLDEELISAIKARRAAFIQQFSNYAEKLPGVYVYGGGFYGLKQPSADIYDSLFAREEFWKRLLFRKQPPLFFERVCEEFKMQPTDERSKLLHDASARWDNVKVLDRAGRFEILFTGWSCKRLLAGIVRNSEQPMTRHEVEWEFREFYEPYVSKADDKRIHDILNYDPLFVERPDKTIACSDSIEHIVPHADVVTEKAVEIILQKNRVVSSEHILEWLQEEGFAVGDVSDEMLTVLLKDNPEIEEVGHGWFTPATN